MAFLARIRGRRVEGRIGLDRERYGVRGARRDGPRHEVGPTFGTCVCPQCRGVWNGGN